MGGGQRFRVKKFLVALVADNLAFFTHPCSRLERVFARRGGDGRRFVDMLSDATWLPLPYREFEDFQMYLIKLWLPTLVSLATYLLMLHDRSHSSVRPPGPLLRTNPECRRSLRTNPGCGCCVVPPVRRCRRPAASRADAAPLFESLTTTPWRSCVSLSAQVVEPLCPLIL